MLNAPQCLANPWIRRGFPWLCPCRRQHSSRSILRKFPGRHPDGGRCGAHFGLPVYNRGQSPGRGDRVQPGVSPRTPGKPCIAGQALNGRQTSCGQRRSAGGLRLFRCRPAAGTYWARDSREVQQKSRRQSKFSMNCGAAAARAPSGNFPFVAVGTGCQPVPGHILHLGFCVKPGSRLAAGTYRARDLREVQQQSR